MTDDKPRPDDETQPVRPEGAARSRTAPDPATAAPRAGPRRRRSPPPRRPAAASASASAACAARTAARTFGLAALIASALAGIIVGGLGFAAVHAIGDDGGRDRGGWCSSATADDLVRSWRHARRPARRTWSAPPTTPPEDDDSGSAS